MANISEISIKRPVLSTVMTIILLLFGMIGYKFLGVREFPSVDNPIISVNVTYPGANADVMAKTVATPLERAINGVPGMTYMTTVCTNDGMSLTTIYFKVGTDPDVASVNVQNRVTTVLEDAA